MKPYQSVARSLSITGLGCGHGPDTVIDDLERTVYCGAALPWGADDLSGHTLALGAERALRDSGYMPDWSTLPVAVVEIGPSPLLESVTMTRRFTGPVRTVSSVGQALITAQELVACRAVEAVLIIDGALAVVGSAPSGGRRAYATIDAFCSVDGTAGDAARSALAIAGARTDQIGYVELCRSGRSDTDLQVLRDLGPLWPDGHAARPAISAASAAETAPSGLLFSLIKVSLCLHYGHRPPWIGHRHDELAAIAGSGLIALTSSVPWIRDGRHDPLRAAVSGYDPSADAQVHAVLSGASVRGDVVEVDWRRADGPVLVPIAGADFPDLMHRLGLTRDALIDGAEPWQWALGTDEQFIRMPHRVVFCAPGPEGLCREIDAAQRLLPKAHEQRKEWVTPSGSCYAPNAIGPAGKVAVVYPGGLTAYPGLGADLYRCFPGLVPRAEAAGGLPHGYFRHTEPLYEGMDFASGATDPVKAELRLHENFAAALNIGLGIGFLQTHALRDLLGIPVHGAFGYSLGEITMLYALGSRQRVDPDLSRDEDLFRERLGGPKTAIRELWGIANEVPDEEVWTTMVLFAEAEVVRAEVECRDHVFLTHINTPGETVIAGNPGACRAVMRALGCPGLPTAVSYVLHCPAVDLQKMNDYIDYRLGPIRRPTDHVELFSGHRAEPLTDFADAAGTAAATLRRAVDFPRLVQSLYRSGYRYFIEVGPGATATRWIGDTLAGRQHLAISADRRGAGTAAGAARMLARLASHGVHIDLSRLVTPTTNKEMSCPTQ